MARIALTGATGVVGGLVARELDARGIPTRLLVRDPARAPRLEHAETVWAGYGGPACTAALAGVQTLLFVSAHEADDRVDTHRALVDSAASAGVEHIVYTSFLGAGSAAGFLLARDHGITEQLIRDAGPAYTFLRDSFYAEGVAHFADESGVIQGPAGRGRVAPVSQRDVAAVASAVLADPAAHAGRAYELTGPTALTFDEIAAILTEATGRAHRYADQTMDEARASRAVYNAPDWLVDAWISTYTAIRDGELDVVSDDVPRLLGRPARSLAEAVRAAGRA